MLLILSLVKFIDHIESGTREKKEYGAGSVIEYEFKVSYLTLRTLPSGL